MGLFQTIIIVILVHHVFDLNNIIDYIVPVYVILSILAVVSYVMHITIYKKEEPQSFTLAPKKAKKEPIGRPDFSGTWKSTRTENYIEFLVAQVRETLFLVLLPQAIFDRVIPLGSW